MTAGSLLGVFGRWKLLEDTQRYLGGWCCKPQTDMGGRSELRQGQTGELRAAGSQGGGAQGRGCRAGPCPCGQTGPHVYLSFLAGISAAAADRAITDPTKGKLHSMLASYSLQEILNEK